MAKEKATKKTLEETMKELDKTYGKGSVIYGNQTEKCAEVVSTGSLGLDIATGIGGIPTEGKIIEVYGWESSGKSTLIQTVIGNYQKKYPERKVLFVDGEGSLDSDYATALGMNMDDILLIQLDEGGGEAAYNKVAALVETGQIGLVIYDSYNSLKPKKLLDGDSGQYGIGLHAKLMDDAVTKSNADGMKYKTTSIYIGQLREKIGVMFGCFHYKAKVLLADGTTESIGKIVNKQMDVEVLSVVDGKITSKRIVDWHNNGKAKKFWLMKVNYPHGKGNSYLRIADDHVIFTPTGERKFSELKVEDEVMVKSFKYLNKEQKQIVIGSMLGDGNIRLTSTKTTGSLRLKHAIGQNDYCKYKAEALGEDFKGSSGFDDKGRFWWDSKNTSEIVPISKYKTKKSVRFVDQELLDQIGLRAIAIWYLDDGTFGGSYEKWGWGKSVIYAKNLAYESKLRLKEKFLELGLPIPSCTKAGLMFSGEDNKLFQEKIAEFVPECMKYKIHPKLQNNLGKNIYFEVGKEELTLIPAKIASIKEVKKDRSTLKFDISVEEGECYFVDNTLVHNSPETTQGGNALRFYAHMRFKTSRSLTSDNSVMEGGEKMGNLHKVKVEKNKLSAPFKSAEYNIVYGQGIDKYNELINIGHDIGMFKIYGESVTVEGDKHKTEDFIQILKDHEELFLKYREDILNKTIYKK